MDSFPLTQDFLEKNRDFFSANVMPGPNPLYLVEYLLSKMDIQPGMRILDMGCGTGLTSIFLAKYFAVTVFATDLWIDATDNRKRFQAMEVADRVFPMHAEAHSLPYAEDFFDAAISVDSYHYYGTSETYFPGTFARLVRNGGQYGIICPGLAREITSIPQELIPYWDCSTFNTFYTFHTCDWWTHLWTKTDLVDISSSGLMPNGKAIWRETADFELHDADKEDLIQIVYMVGRRK